MRTTARLLTWAVAPILVVGLALVGYGVVIEPDRLVVRRLAMTSPHWPATASPVRIAVIADIHAGAPHVDTAKLAAIVDRVNGARPDIVVLLGDYVIHGVIGGRFVAPEATAGHLAGLRAPLGVFSVLGNHDWWLDGDRVRRALEAAGIAVLENTSLRIASDRHEFWLAGLADDSTRTPDGRAALTGVPPGRPVIMLMHDPAAIDQVPPGTALSLAGHTHGGQIHLPWLFPPVTPGRAGPDYAYGTIAIDDKLLYVSGGIGTSILPIRINMPPEIVIITLSSGR